MRKSVGQRILEKEIVKRKFCKNFERGRLLVRRARRCNREDLEQFAFVERSGTMKAPVGLLSDRTVLRQQDGGASPRQVQVCLPLTMLCRKSPQTVVWGFFVCGGQYRMGTASVFPARFSIAFRRKVCFNKKSHTAI